MTKDRYCGILNGDPCSEYERLEIRCAEVLSCVDLFPRVICVVGDHRQDPGIMATLLKMFDQNGVHVTVTQIGNAKTISVKTEQTATIKMCIPSELAGGLPDITAIVDFRLDNSDFPWWEDCRAVDGDKTYVNSNKTSQPNHHTW